MAAPEAKEDGAAAAAAADASLAGARAAYQWASEYVYAATDDHEAFTVPVAKLLVEKDVHPLPPGEFPTAAQLLMLAGTVVDLALNFLAKVDILLGASKVPTGKFAAGAAAAADDGDAPPDDGAAKPDFLTTVKHLRQAVKKLSDLAVEDAEDSDSEQDKGLAEQVIDGAADVLAKRVVDKAADVLPFPGVLIRKKQPKVAAVIAEVLKLVLHLAATYVGHLLGLRGRPHALQAYEELFQTFPVPPRSAEYGDEYSFARARVAGPNPMVLARCTQVPAKFPVDARRYAAVMGGDSLVQALGEGRVFLCDYAALAAMESEPATGKVVGAPLGLFATRPGGDRALVAVAIQCGQEPGADTPVLYADDGERWELAKLHFSAADGAHHELVSHLALTHLLVEPFAVATHRCLPPEHPLFLLLVPHFQGTLFINSQAMPHLMQPGGIVNQLLAGTIESDWAVVTDALADVDFASLAVPTALARRGVLDRAALPDFPYRDDALLVWGAVEAFVAQYVDLYYGDNVAGDRELQAWVRELAEFGKVKGVAEEGADGGIVTKAYLVRVLATVIFTASAQHAAINFPQASYMSYTPLMPLAPYGPPPSRDVSTAQPLDQLPPMEMAVLQLVIGKGLGSVYFTRLGQYDRHQPRVPALKPYFTDKRAQAAQAAFADELRKVEREIGRRNGQRGSYVQLLPSRIPQSINI